MEEARVSVFEAQASPICCPSCRLVLRNFELEPRLFLNFCLDCKVAWCDRDEIGRMAGVSEAVALLVCSHQALDSAPFSNAGATEPICPRCDGVHLIPASFLDVKLLHCPACRGNLLDLSGIGKIKRAAVAARTSAVRPNYFEVQASETQNSNQSSFFDYGDDKLLSGCAIPLAVAVGFLGQRMGLSSALFLLGGTLPHEFGHALGGWLGGYFSVPTLFFTHILVESSSGFVSGLVSLALLYCYFLWLRKDRKIGLIEGMLVRFGFIALAAVHVKLAWMSTAAFQQEVFICMGVVGEFLITTVGVALFCLRSVPIPRWDFWRYPVLLFSAVHFVGSWTFWGRVLAGGEAAIPWGILLGTTTADGDFSKLRDVYGWTGGEILKLIRHLREFGMAAILSVAAFQLRLLLQRGSSNGVQQDGAGL